LIVNSITYSLGLIGYPVSHSLSPHIHNAALRSLGLAGDYRLFPIPPMPEGLPQLEKLLDTLRRGELCGLNVTIPHKQSVLPLVDELTSAAQSIGAVNTLYIRKGALVGDNTDASGFAADLERVLGPRQGTGLSKTGSHAWALILGAGGSARAVVYALIQTGWKVHIAARRLEQADELTFSLMDLAPPGALAASRLGELPGTIARCPFHLIVNTTPIGMVPKASASPWPSGLPLPTSAFVYDLVYNPPQTSLVKAAIASGLGASNGLGMLVEQAALAFERWTGQAAPRDVMHSTALSFRDD
jgi:shikimate dehydrogenase